MSKNRRSELEIISQMLSIADNGIKKTRLMYKTNMCYVHLTEYMSFLSEKGFLGVKKTNPEGNIYYTTEKGKKFLESIKNVFDQVK